MTTLQVTAQKRLRSHIEAIERLQTQQRELGEDISECMREAKGEGFDPKIIRKVLAIRKKSKAEWAEEEAILSTYLSALGMAGTPLGDYLEEQDRLETVRP